MQIEKGTGQPQIRPHFDSRTGAINQPRSKLGEQNVRTSLAKKFAELRSKGVTPSCDPTALAKRIAKLEDGQAVDVPEIGLKFVGKQDQGVEYGPGPALSHRYPARIAYLSLVAAGADLLDPSLTNWRRYITGEIDQSLENGVIIGRPESPTKDAVPYHFVQVSDKIPGVGLVDVVLFGCWTWRALFPLREPQSVEFTVIGVDLAVGETVVYVGRDRYSKAIGWVLPGPDPVGGWSGS